MLPQLFLRRLLTAICICISSAAITQNLDWPQFRGINSSGIAAPGADPPTEFAIDKNLLWRTELMPGFSSPCISNGRIFLTGCDKANSQFYVYAIDGNLGKTLWTRTLTIETLESVHPVSNEANATPATDGHNVVVYFPSFGLLCYDFDGNELWRTRIPVPVSNFGSGTSPVIANGLVLLNLSNDKSNPRIAAWNISDGSQGWSVDLVPDQVVGTEGYSTPVLYGDEFIVYRNVEIAAFKIETGQKIWSCGTNTHGTSTAVISDSTVYVGTHTSEGLGDPEKMIKMPPFDELLKNNDANKDSSISYDEFPDDLILVQRTGVTEEFGGYLRFKNLIGMFDKDQNSLVNGSEWNAFNVILRSYFTEHGLVAIRLGGRGDVSFTHQLWKQPDGVAEVPSPLAYEGRIYEVQNGGIVTCVSAGTGDIIYQQRLGASGPYFSSPILAGNRIYACSRNGVVSVFPTGDTFRLLFQTPLGENINATPAVVGNVLYVRTDKTLYAFGKQVP
jgi:outer membrane protein assembly factor BamB